jgi:hypothetical protein
MLEEWGRRDAEKQVLTHKIKKPFPRKEMAFKY